ncbi:hypothetical protein CSKR_201933 [Clonorchis sinensis]|uniref:Uncharacterized protein n=1 Tax=Clonorchis sinensis TaxID=79923 RepID=A0A8T1MZ25_CLOSI|nr:hypothetical protein CSKR_201933 [Clonorchis sinensis]
MQSLSLFGLAILVVYGSSRTLETEVRILVPNSPRGPFKPCTVLENLSLKQWTDRIFSGCAFERMTFHKDPRLEMQFQIDVAVNLFPSEYQNLSFPYFVWYVNRLLNKNDSSCPTATGKRRQARYYEAMSNYKEFFLVGPNNGTLCSMLLKQKFKKTGMNIESCNIVDRNAKPVDGYMLANYRLNVSKSEKNEYPLNYLLFLRMVNKNQGCMYNGFWSKHDITMVNPSDDDDDDDDAEDADDDDLMLSDIGLKDLNLEELIRSL